MRQNGRIFYRVNLRASFFLRLQRSVDRSIRYEFQPDTSARSHEKQSRQTDRRTDRLRSYTIRVPIEAPSPENIKDHRQTNEGAPGRPVAPAPRAAARPRRDRIKVNNGASTIKPVTKARHPCIQLTRM
ncbi:hypothetical protein EVAR_59417_1 [Eumeta japonica]|uniref:Uncharacterized protein n=1 Tax=Eumeta variegata TaxID=151549 RepID=A0A4C1Z460_EUMVA|nr:hypothetical protein EVAR_59417_1 [Eumeta japonica]